jgi:hypothetical protein
VIVLGLALAACQPPDDDEPPLVGAVVIEGPAEGSQFSVPALDGDEFGVTVATGTRARIEHRENLPPRAEVVGPHIAFSANATGLAYHAADELWLWQGRVRIAAGLWVSDVELRDGRLWGTANPGPEFELRGLSWPPQRLVPRPPPAHAASFTRWWAPSESEAQPAEEIDEAPNDVSEPDLTVDDGPVWLRPPVADLRRVRAYPAGSSLTLYASPSQLFGHPLTLQTEGSFPRASFQVLQSNERWTEVRWQNALIDLRAFALTENLHFIKDTYGGYGVGRGCLCGLGHRPGPRARTTLPPGTVIHARAGVGPWARVHTAVTVDLWLDDTGWGQVGNLPDLASHSQYHAWVDLRPLSLQPIPGDR